MATFKYFVLGFCGQLIRVHRVVIITQQHGNDIVKLTPTALIYQLCYRVIK